jgi:hypothetical protein
MLCGVPKICFQYGLIYRHLESRIPHQHEQHKVAMLLILPQSLWNGGTVQNHITEDVLPPLLEN